MFLDVFCVSYLAILGVEGWVLHGMDAAKDVATHNGSTLGACRKGYTDILCMDCAPKYFATGNQCEQCHDTMMFSKKCTSHCGSNHGDSCGDRWRRLALGAAQCAHRSTARPKCFRRFEGAAESTTANPSATLLLGDDRLIDMYK